MKKRNQSILTLNKKAISTFQSQKLEVHNLQNVVGGQEDSSSLIISELDIF
ncbi:MAG: hypothetical protein AAF611_16685 [Bacteroidota bacterium]